MLPLSHSQCLWSVPNMTTVPLFLLYLGQSLHLQRCRLAIWQMPLVEILSQCAALNPSPTLPFPMLMSASLWQANMCFSKTVHRGKKDTIRILITVNELVLLCRIFAWVLLPKLRLMHRTHHRGHTHKLYKACTHKFYWEQTSWFKALFY